MLASVFKNTWYPNFVPKGEINKFTVYGWKTVSISPGTQEVILKRLHDGKTRTEPFKYFKEFAFLPAEDYIRQMNALGFKLVAQEDSLLVFQDECGKEPFRGLNLC